MSKARQTLARRRHVLVARCEMQRIELIQRSHEVHGLMLTLDRTVHTVQQVRQHQGMVMVALAALLLVIRPRRIAALTTSVATAGRTWKMIAPALQSLRR